MWLLGATSGNQAHPCTPLLSSLCPYMNHSTPLCTIPCPSVPLPVPSLILYMPFHASLCAHLNASPHPFPCPSVPLHTLSVPLCALTVLCTLLSAPLCPSMSHHALSHYFCTPLHPFCTSLCLSTPFSMPLCGPPYPICTLSMSLSA